MAIGETCGLKTTNESLDVFVALGDDYGYINDEFQITGKRIWGIYNSIKDCKNAKH